MNYKDHCNRRHFRVQDRLPIFLMSRHYEIKKPNNIKLNIAIKSVPFFKDNKFKMKIKNT